MLYPPGFIGTLPNPSYAEAPCIPIASLVPSLVGRVGSPELGLTLREHAPSIFHSALESELNLRVCIAICLPAGFIHHG